MACKHFWSRWQIWKMAGRCWMQRECLWCSAVERDPDEMKEASNG